MAEQVTIIDIPNSKVEVTDVAIEAKLRFIFRRQMLET